MFDRILTAILIAIPLQILASIAAAQNLPQFDLTDFAPGKPTPADVASGCDFTKLMACTDPSDGTGTNWIGPLEAAAAAAGAAGGGVINVPPGDYRFGVAGSPGWEEGAVITQDNVWVSCEPGARLLPGGTAGAHVLNWCHDSACPDEGTATPVQGGGIIGCEFLDDDPERTGHSYQIASANGGLVGGPPAVGQVVFFGGNQGTVVAWDGVADEIRIKPLLTGPSDLLKNGDTVTSVPPAWTITDVQAVTGRSEESHGVAVLNVENWTATDSGCRNIGDECFDIGGRAGPPATPNQQIEIINPWCRNTPSMPSGGSCVSIIHTVGTRIENIDFGEVWMGPWSGNRAIDLSTIAAVAHSDVVIDGGLIDSTHDGILLGVQLADWSDIEITGLTLVADAPGVSSITRTGNGTLFDVDIHHNTIAGRVNLLGTRTRFANNNLTLEQSSSSNALFVGGTDVDVLDNTIDGGTGGCMILNELTGAMISRNICTTNTDSIADPVINILSLGPCALIDVTVQNNTLRPKGAASVGINGRVAPNGCPTHRAIGNTIDLSAGSTNGTNGILHLGTVTGNTVIIPGPGDAGIQTNVNFPGAIADNHVTMGGNNADGIVLNNLVGFTVEGNRIFGVSGPSGWAIEEMGSADSNELTGNRSAPPAGGSVGSAFHAATTAIGGCDGGGPVGATGTVCSGNLVCGTATDDPDCDWLSDLAEAAAGTDPADPDSDNDGLLDGDEVDVYGTQPLLRDSDGDGYHDGLEVRAGTDPNDAGAHPSYPAVPSLSLLARLFGALMLGLAASRAFRRRRSV